jgi:phosphotransacetylase
MEAESVGPISVGMAQAVHPLQHGFEAEGIVNVATIAALTRDSGASAARQLAAVAVES